MISHQNMNETGYLIRFLTKKHFFHLEILIFMPIFYILRLTEQASRVFNHEFKHAICFFFLQENQEKSGDLHYHRIVVNLRIHLLEHPQNSLQRFLAYFTEYAEFDYFFDFQILVIHQQRSCFNENWHIPLEDDIQSNIILHFIFSKCSLVNIKNDRAHQMHWNSPARQRYHNH